MTDADARQGRELERMGALETEWREREAGRAAQAAVRAGELATLEAAARKARVHPAAQAWLLSENLAKFPTTQLGGVRLRVSCIHCNLCVDTGAIDDTGQGLCATWFNMDHLVFIVKLNDGIHTRFLLLTCVVISKEGIMQRVQVPVRCSFSAQLYSSSWRARSEQLARRR